MKKSGILLLLILAMLFGGCQSDTANSTEETKQNQTQQAGPMTERGNTEIKKIFDLENTDIFKTDNLSEAVQIFETVLRDFGIDPTIRIEEESVGLNHFDKRAFAVYKDIKISTMNNKTAVIEIHFLGSTANRHLSATIIANPGETEKKIYHSLVEKLVKDAYQEEVKSLFNSEQKLGTFYQVEHGVIYLGGRKMPDSSDIRKEDMTRLELKNEDFILEMLDFKRAETDLTKFVAEYYDFVTKTLNFRPDDVIFHASVKNSYDLVTQESQEFKYIEFSLKLPNNQRHSIAVTKDGYFAEFDRDEKDLKTILDYSNQLLAKTTKGVQLEVFETKELRDQEGTRIQLNDTGRSWLMIIEKRTLLENY